MRALVVAAMLAQCADCPDPGRPWMRGRIVYSCAVPRDLARVQLAHAGRTVKACACVHTCDDDAPHADETDNRGGDARCEARCNPRNCRCPHPCES